MTEDGRLDEVFRRYRFLPASHVLKTRRFGRHQDHRTNWLARDQCWLLLFVSHRWESPDHPDPAGRQHRALRSLLHQLCDLVDAVTASDAAQRRRLVPDLACVGALQAAILLLRLQLPDGVGHDTTPGWAHRMLPDHVGIWYDYACLPQRPRSADEEAAFQEALLELPTLFAAEPVTLLSLREAGDDYETRAWCLAEALLTANRIVNQAVTLRIDRAGHPLSPASSDAQSDTKLGTRLTAALRGWQTTEDPEAAADCLQLVALVAGSSPSEWFRPEDDINPVYAGAVVEQAAVWLGSVLAAIGRADGAVLDLTAVLHRLAQRSGVRCSLDNDLVLVILLMIEGTAAPESEIKAFYRRCRERHLTGRPLQVVRLADGNGGLGYDNLALADE